MRNFQVNQQGFFAVITKCLLMLALTHKLVITKHVLSPIYSIVYILYRPYSKMADTRNNLGSNT